jgi:hypothetical protein
MSDLKDLLQRAEEIRLKYEELNAKSGRDAWRIRDYAMGFVGDVGDLQKLVMAKENLREIDDVDAKLANELAECLWAILVISKYYGIDLEKEFDNKISDIQKKVEKKYES